MKKGITKEQTINKALELIKDTVDIRSVNLRVIARGLGCAHTNIYNYFPSLDALLWEAYTVILERFSKHIEKSISGMLDYQMQLERFVAEIVNFYLDNKGWFRLIWVEIIGEERPESNQIFVCKNLDRNVDIVSDILINAHKCMPDRNKLKNTIHVVHCYIYGEISMFIANHSLIKDESELRKYIVDEAMKMLQMYLSVER